MIPAFHNLCGEKEPIEEFIENFLN